MSYMSVHKRMDRRMGGARVRTDCPLTAYCGGAPQRFRAIDLSCSGALVQRRLATRRPPAVHALELDLKGRRLRTLARTVWVNQQQHGVRFIDLSDADRLEIAEHIDEERRRRLGL